ncbi:MAG TPA: hypothetical protein VLW54_01660 [Candidatus Acidoferrales bacterium]|nr:hypothetical protein [Candidatus Acidoferrales bacterium]
MLSAVRSLPHRAALLLAGLVLVAAVSHADDFWKHKPRSEWTLKESLKLLEDSPWARQEIRALAGSTEAPELSIDRSHRHCDPDLMDSGGNCLQTRVRAPSDSSTGRMDVPMGNGIVFLVRWESSAPVEDAFARLMELGERATAEYLSIPPRLPPDRYVVTLKALEKAGPIGSPPGSMPLDPIGPLTDDDSGPRAHLSVAGVTIAPLESLHSGVGASEAAHFYFPRVVNGAPLFPPGGRSRATFEFHGKRFSVKTHFTLDQEVLR